MGKLTSNVRQPASLQQVACVMTICWLEWCHLPLWYTLKLRALDLFLTQRHNNSLCWTHQYSHLINQTYTRQEICHCFIPTKQRVMIPQPFWTAIKKGMLQITKGELRSLDMPEKRQLLADLRKRGDCPENWKNTDPKRQTAILEGLRSAIQRRLLKKEEYKKRSQKAYKKRKSSGKIAQAGAKRSKALHDAKARAIAECKDRDRTGNVWEPEKLKKEVKKIFDQIVEKCGGQGFVHVMWKSWTRFVS